MTTDLGLPLVVNRRVTSTTDVPAQIKRLRRQAEMYRLLAGIARTDAARRSYTALAADYDDLAARTLQTLTLAKT